MKGEVPRFRHQKPKGEEVTVGGGSDAPLRDSGHPNGLAAAWAALVVGVGYAAVSLYWAVGGTWLLDTVGAPFDEQGRARNAGVILALVWTAVALKLIAAALPLLALHRLPPARNRLVWLLTWGAAAVLTTYGLLWTAAGLLAQADVIHAPASRAMAWHAYMWDPWFLLWGLLAATALLQGRRASPGSTKITKTILPGTSKFGVQR